MSTAVRARPAAGAGSATTTDVLVVFGISGDLAKVMTFRSLYRLERRGLLDSTCARSRSTGSTTSWARWGSPRCSTCGSANAIFEPIWNRNYVSSVQITMAEDSGVDDRGHFYDPVGALRDGVVNHLMQLPAAVAMEPPSGRDERTLKDAIAAVLRAMQPADPAHYVRGQHDGYREQTLGTLRVAFLSSLASPPAGSAAAAAGGTRAALRSGSWAGTCPCG